MQFYEDHVVPRLIDCFLNNRWFDKQRRRTLASARGRGLEVGFGTGLNLRHFPEGVDSLVAMEPSQSAFRLAGRRIRQAGFPVEHLCSRCEEAQLESAQFDFVVTTCALCSIQDPLEALRRMREALKPGGQYLFLEHGRSANRLVVHLQDLWTPIHRRLFGGCHLNRPIRKLIEDAGFKAVSLQQFNPFGLGLFFSMYRGIAVLQASGAQCRTSISAKKPTITGDPEC